MPEQLMMIRIGLDDLPELPVPAGFRLRTFQPGDETGWEQIIAEAFTDGQARSFRIMRDDPAFAPQRVHFVEHIEDGSLVATAAGYSRAQFPDDWGYLHYVGTRPSFGGRGLGKSVSLAALRQLRDEGKKIVVLHTDDFRHPALRIYTSLGFVPYPSASDPTQAERWLALVKAGLIPPVRLYRGCGSRNDTTPKP